MTDVAELRKRLEQAQLVTLAAVEELEAVEEDVRQAQVSLKQRLEELLLAGGTAKAGLDEEAVEAFANEPYVVLPSGKPNEWHVAVPRFLTDFHVGFLAWSTDSYNVFAVNRYAQYFGDIPASIAERFDFKPELDARVADGSVHVPGAAEQEEVVARYGEHLTRRKGQTEVGIKPGREFQLIAAMVRDGILPFVPRPVAREHLRAPAWSPEAPVVLREYQQRAFDEWLRRGSVGIYWPTSAGKTYAALAACASLKGRKLVIVPNNTLVEQWRERVNRHLDWSARREVEVYTYQAFQKLRQQMANKSWVSPTLIVFDEVHHLPSDTFSKWSTLPVPYRMGLSASAYREDGRSVGYDEPVLVNIGGVSQIKKVGQLIDSLLKPGVDVADIDGVKVLAADGAGLAWLPATQVSRHKPSEEMMRVWTEGGRSVVVTTSHSVMTVSQDFRIVAKRAGDLRQGDVLLAPRRIEAGANEANLARARLLGWYVAEGSSRSSKRGACVAISLNANERAEAEQIQGEWATLGHQASIVKDGPNSIRVQVSTHAAYDELIASSGLSGQKAYTKRVPTEVFNYTQAGVEAFLNAYHKGDAGVTVNRDLASDLAFLYAMVGKFAPIHWSLNKGGTSKFADGHVIEKDVQRFHVAPNVDTRQSPTRMLPIEYLEAFGAVRTSQRKEGAVKKADSFSAASFEQRFGGEGVERLTIIREAVKNQKVRVSDVVRLRGVERRTAEAFVRYLGKRGLLQCTKKGHRWVGEGEWEPTDEARRIVEVYENMQKMFDGDFAFVRVKEVETIQYEHEYVYDFHVPGSQTFVAGEGGLLCHNTDLILALTGYPIGADWRELEALGVVELPDVTLHLVADMSTKLRRLEALLKDKRKTLIFCDSIDLGGALAKRFELTFVSGSDKKDRLSKVREALASRGACVVSRVADEGLSLVELERVIEYDFHAGSRRQEIQRMGRVMHGAEKGEHHIIMTTDEHARHEKRLLSIREKGIRIQVMQA